MTLGDGVAVLALFFNGCEESVGRLTQSLVLRCQLSFSSHTHFQCSRQKTQLEFTWAGSWYT